MFKRPLLEGDFYYSNLTETYCLQTLNAKIMHNLVQNQKLLCIFAATNVSHHVEIANFKQCMIETQATAHICGLLICVFIQVFGDTLHGHGWESTFCVETFCHSKVTNK